MLIKIDGDVVIKADRYCFQVCEYRGMTKFPGGASPYSKPNKYCGNLFEMARIITSEGGDPSLLIEAMRADYRLWKWLSNADLSDQSGKTSKWFGYGVKFDRDCYRVKVGSTYTTYHPKLGYALYHCWNVHLREHGSFGGEHTKFMENYDNATKEEIDAFLSDYERFYANPSVIVDEADAFQDAICKEYGIEFTFDGKYRRDLGIDKEVTSGKK